MTICDKLKKTLVVGVKKGPKSKVSLCITLLHPHSLCPYSVFLLQNFVEWQYLSGPLYISLLNQMNFNNKSFMFLTIGSSACHEFDFARFGNR